MEHDGATAESSFTHSFPLFMLAYQHTCLGAIEHDATQQAPASAARSIDDMHAHQHACIE
jgi:hypothetical protein